MTPANKTRAILAIIIGAFAFLTACGTTAPGSTGNAAYDLEIAKANATAAAVQTNAFISANADATNDARTAIAVNRSSTQAAEIQKNAILYAQATNTAQAGFSQATATAQYNNARNAETAQAQQSEFNATQQARRADAAATADAQNWQATVTADARSYQATATTERRAIEAEIARVQATATAQAITTAILQAQKDDADANARTSVLLNILVLVIVLLVILLAFALAVLVFGGVAALRQSFAAKAARQLVIETRSGTIMLERTEDGTFVPRLVKSITQALPSGEDFDASEANTSSTLKVRGQYGKTSFISHDDPLAQMRENDRKLAMSLLRDSLKLWELQNKNTHTANQVASWRALEWGAATWQRAVNLMRPYLVTREGRGGGTYCGEQFPTLIQLYNALGERKADLALLDDERATLAA